MAQEQFTYSFYKKKQKEIKRFNCSKRLAQLGGETTLGGCVPCATLWCEQLRLFRKPSATPGSSSQGHTPVSTHRPLSNDLEAGVNHPLGAEGSMRALYAIAECCRHSTCQWAYLCLSRRLCQLSPAFKLIPLVFPPSLILLSLLLTKLKALSFPGILTF